MTPLRELQGLTGAEMLELWARAHDLCMTGRYREAEAILAGLSALDPGESYFLAARGYVYLAQDRVDEALVHLDAAIALNGHDLAAHATRGEARLRKGLVHEALEDLDRAASLDRDGKHPIAARARSVATAARARLNSGGGTHRP